MAITKINSMVAKHGRILFAVFTLVIIVSFVWFLTPGTSGELFFRGQEGPGATIGKVFGRNVSYGEAVKAQKDIVLFYAVRLGTAPSAVNARIPLEQGFSLILTGEVANQLGVSISDARIGEFIRGLEIFQDNGKFNPEKYAAYEKDKLIPEGFTAVDVDRAVKAILLAEEVNRVAAGETIVTPSELEAFQRTNMEKLKLRSITFSPADFVSSVKTDDKALEAYYKANAKDFMTEPKYKAEIVEFKFSAFGKDYTPSEADIKKHYEANKDSFKGQPVEKVTKQIAAQLKKEFSRNAAVNAAYDFREKLYQASAELSGEAKDYIAAFDTEAVKAGHKPVATDWFTAASGVNGEQAISAAVAKTEKRRPITNSIIGGDGAYVAVRTDMIESAPAKFADCKEKVRAAYVRTRSVKAAQEAANDFAAKMADSKTPAADFVKLAGSAKLKDYKEFSLATFSSEVPVTAISLALDTREGALSTQASTPDGILMVFVDKRTQPSEKEMAEQKKVMEIYYRMAKMQQGAASVTKWISSNCTSKIQGE